MVAQLPKVAPVVTDAELAAFLRDRELRDYLWDCVEERYTDHELGPTRAEPGSRRERVWRLFLRLDREGR